MNGSACVCFCYCVPQCVSMGACERKHVLCMLMQMSMSVWVNGMSVCFCLYGWKRAREKGFCYPTRRAYSCRCPLFRLKQMKKTDQRFKVWELTCVWWRRVYGQATEFFKNPILPYIALISVFHLIDGAARFYYDYYLFTSPLQACMLEHVTTFIGRESVHMAGCLQG